MSWYFYVLIAIGSYLLGNVHGSILIGKILKGIDVRDYGSGNAGATNTARVLGMTAGIAAMVFDILKAVAATWIAVAVVGNMAGAVVGKMAGYTAYIAVVLGHNYPVLFRFKGGKGMSSSLGGIFVLFWPIAVIVFVLELVLTILTKRVSVASLTCVTLYPILTLVFGYGTDAFIVAMIIWTIGVFQHRENIKRLIKGEEKKLVIKKMSRKKTASTQ